MKLLDRDAEIGTRLNQVNPTMHPLYAGHLLRERRAVRAELERLGPAGSVADTFPFVL
jgi:hypothetical protein